MIPDASHNSGSLQFETVLYNSSGQQTSSDTHIWLLQDYSYPANHIDMFTAPSLTGYYSTPRVSAWTWFDYNGTYIFNWGTSQIYCTR